MMAGGPNRTLKLSYVGDTKGLNKANAEAESSLQKLGGGFKKFGKIAAVGFAAAGVAAVAVGKKLFDAAEAASSANARIETITKSMDLFGDNAGAVSSRLVKLAEDQAKLTGVSRTTIKETSALLLTFEGLASSADEVGGTFDRAQTAALDLAAAGFGSATGNAQALGKALNDPIKGISALTRSGVTFTDAEKERIKVLQESNQLGAAQEIVLAAIEKQVGGTAAATASGSSKLRESFGVLVDQVALALAPAFEKLVVVAGKVIERLQELWEENGPAIIDFVGRAQDKFTALYETFKERVVPVLKTVISNVVEFIKAIREWWQRVSPGVLESFKRLKDPIVELWTNIKEAFGQMKDLIGAFRSGESDGQGFQRFIDGLVNVIGLLIRGLNIAISAMNRFRDILIRIVESKAFQALLSGIGAIGGAVGRGIGKIAGLANGGIVTRPTLAMVGEGGEPEAVIPLSKMGQMGGGTVINIQTGVGDPEAIARSIRRILNDSERRVGGLVAA
jgi:phage-related protein